MRICLPLLFACRGPVTGAAGASGEQGADTAAFLADTAVEAQPDAPEETISTALDLFDPTRVHAVGLTLSEAAWTTLNEDSVPRGQGEAVYVEADLSFDGVERRGVALKIKGGGSTFRDLSGKPSLRVDLNRLTDQDLGGLEAILLNNMIVDCAMLRDHLANRVYASAGLPVARTAYAWVTLNEAELGLYLITEPLDDVFLERHYARPDGNLYGADGILQEDGSLRMVDLTSDRVDDFVLEEGVDNERSDLRAVVDALDLDAGDLAGETGALVDWGRHQRLVAAEMWVGQNDGYSLNRNNYLVYVNPRSGQIELLPRDHDHAFLHAADWGRDWTLPVGRLTARCLADPTCAAAQQTWHSQIDTIADPAALIDQIDAVEALLEPHIWQDTRQECTEDEVHAARRALRRWSEARGPELAEGEAL